jgi:hypothetical protein
MAIIPILPQTNDPKETQRALLDLASKIPSSSGGNIYALNQANYTETNNDAYDMIDVNCGASSRTITLRKAGTTLLRRRMYAKNDSGAGEILLVAQAGQKIYYPGGSASQMYVGLQYQFVTLEETASGYYITGGVVQPVPGEPSQGTPHYHYALIVSAVPINNSVQVLPLAGIVPAGAKIAEGRWYIGGNVNNALYIYDTAGVNITDALTVQVTGVTNLGHWKAALDSSLNLRWGTNSFLTTTAVALVLVWYYA